MPARSRASPRKPIDHMTALFILTQYFRDLGLQDLVVVAPDAGRVKLNKKFASKLGAAIAILDKERPAQQVAEIGYVIGDVKGKTALIVDDIIDTAATLKVASQTVLDAGARAVYAAATHPVLSGNAFENLADGGHRADRRHRHDPAARRRAGQHQGPLLRRAAHRLDPQHLLGPLGERRVRRREPALLSRRSQPTRPPCPTARPRWVCRRRIEEAPAPRRPGASRRDPARGLRRGHARLPRTRPADVLERDRLPGVLRDHPAHALRARRARRARARRAVDTGVGAERS